MFRRAVVGTVAILSLTLAGCGSDDGGGGGGGEDAGSGEVGGTLRIFAYVDAFDPDVFDPFLDQYPDIDVKKAEIAGDTEAVAKLKGGFETDVVNTCAGPVDQEIADGSLQPIDTSRIDDWDAVYPFFKQVKGVDVDGETYMLPMVGGATAWSTGLPSSTRRRPRGWTSTPRTRASRHRTTRSPTSSRPAWRSGTCRRRP